MKNKRFVNFSNNLIRILSIKMISLNEQLSFFFAVSKVERIWSRAGYFISSTTAIHTSQRAIYFRNTHTKQMSNCEMMSKTFFETEQKVVFEN